MGYEQVKMANVPQVGERPFFLEGRDRLLFGASVVITGAVLFTAQKLGLVDTYLDTIESLSHMGEVADKLNHFEFRELWENSLLLKQAAMGLGLLTALVTDAAYIADVLWHLRDKANFSGNHEYEVTEQGIRVGNKNCGDKRIPENRQNTVALGAGTMGGWWVIFQTAAQGIHSLGGDNALTNYFTGYLMGRTALSGAYAFGNSLLTSWNDGLKPSIQGQGPYRENELPHRDGCGMTGTVNIALHSLKFSEHAHKPKIKALDFLNRPAQFVNTAVWEPMVNVVVFPASLGTYIINPNFGTQELTVKTGQ